MFDVFLLFSFFLMIFGTVGTQLFGGSMLNRCVIESRSNNGTVSYTKVKDIYGDDIFCSDQFSGCDQGQACIYWGNPVFGTLSFDNILVSVLNVFEIITLEGWTYVMYEVRHATGSYLYDSFFYFTVIIGSFFILNLMVAVQYSYLSQSFQEPKHEEEEVLEEPLQLPPPNFDTEQPL